MKNLVRLLSIAVIGMFVQAPVADAKSVQSFQGSRGGVTRIWGCQIHLGTGNEAREAILLHEAGMQFGASTGYVVNRRPIRLDQKLPSDRVFGPACSF